MSTPQYNYYDTPEGEDVHKKLWIAMQYSGAAGLGISTADVMLYSHPKGYMQTLGRYLYMTGPIMGIAGAFVIVSNLAASYRQKNDKLNYILGACAAGGVVGAWRRNVMTGIVSSVAFSIAGMVKKEAIDQGWELMPKNVKLQHGNFRTCRHDYTLTADRPQYRNWTTGEKP